MWRRIFNNRIYTLELRNKIFKSNKEPLRRYIKNVSNIHAVYQTSTLHQRHYSEKIDLESLIVDFYYVKNAIFNPEILIMDVREPEEIMELGNIPSSINIPLDDVYNALGKMSDAEFREIYQRQKPGKESEIIIYCKIGRRSTIAQQIAIDLGYTNVKNYIGSFTDWASRFQ